MGIFDIFTNTNAQDAANLQIAGIQKGQTAADTALGQGRNALTTNYSAALQPFLQNLSTAQGGVAGLTDALGLTGDPSQVQARLAQTPGYQFQLNQGNENVLRNQTRTGALNSGATNLDLQAQGQGLANQTYQQYVQNLMPFLGASNTAATGAANVSTGLGNALNANYGSEANLGYTAATGAGNALANADLAKNTASANIWNAGFDIAKLATGVGGSGGFNAANFGGVTNGGPLSFIGNQNPSPGFNTFAKGGRPPPGFPALVGEEGPELFVPDRPGTVIPNGKFAGGLSRFLKAA